MVVHLPSTRPRPLLRSTSPTQKPSWRPWGTA